MPYRLFLVQRYIGLFPCQIQILNSEQLNFMNLPIISFNFKTDEMIVEFSTFGIYACYDR
jgi:hypothetical protein